MVVSVAPAVRVAISEAFDLPPGAVTIGQIVTGLKLLGFDHVFGELPLISKRMSMTCSSVKLQNSQGLWLNVTVIPQLPTPCVLCVQLLTV